MACSAEHHEGANGELNEHASACSVLLTRHKRGRRALQEARMPAGPRLLLLHHLEQYKYVLKPGMPAPGAPPLPPQPAPLPQAPAKQHKRPTPAIL